MAKPKLMLFDSKSKKKLEFKPIVPGKVGMYVCGVTPYDYSHIGHARAYVAFDVLHRYLKYMGYDVKYVRNFTDIDDKIIKRANENGEDPLTLSARFSTEFLKDMAELQCLPPSVEPLVSEHMEQIKDMIAKILANGCAYVLDGDVYFSVDKFPEYGRLSGRNQDDNRAGGGGRVSVDLRKRNPADFALWKAAKPLEISWPSEWGPGRPGWHIECSAMSSQYLGHCFDIHGGGKDLIFPHHENELAQSCAACPESNINYWMHNGFVNRDNIKMSKSESNFFTIRDIIRMYHPLALRFFLMRTHYRADVNYSDRLLQNASDRVYKIYQTLHDCEKALSPYMGEDLKQKVIEQKIPGDIQKAIKEFHQGFLAKMSDDLQTTAFLDSIEPFRTVINNNLMKVKPQKGKMPPVIRGLVELEKELKDVLGIVGLMSSLACAEVIQELKNKALERAGLTVEEVNQHICDRTEAKKVKDFTRADAIRQELKTRGIYLEDEKDGSMTWRPCEPEMQPEVQPDGVPTSTLGVPLSVGVVNGDSEVIRGSSSADPPIAEVVNGAALPEKQTEVILVSSSADPPSTEAVNGAALAENKSEAIPGPVDAACSEVIDDATVPEKQVEMIHGSSLGESALTEVYNSATRREKQNS